jgi:hypothetical protein
MKPITFEGVSVKDLLLPYMVFPPEQTLLICEQLKSMLQKEKEAENVKGLRGLCILVDAITDVPERFLGQFKLFMYVTNRQTLRYFTEQSSEYGYYFYGSFFTHFEVRRVSCMTSSLKQQVFNPFTDEYVLMPISEPFLPPLTDVERAMVNEWYDVRIRFVDLLIKAYEWHNSRH